MGVTSTPFSQDGREVNVVQVLQRAEQEIAQQFLAEETNLNRMFRFEKRACLLSLAILSDPQQELAWVV